jgi:hypothetical protein
LNASALFTPPAPYGLITTEAALPEAVCVAECLAPLNVKVYFILERPAAGGGRQRLKHIK